MSPAHAGQPELRPLASSYSMSNVEEPFRAARACVCCNKKKTKCDMRRPVCGLCARTGIECEYPLFRKRPSRSGSSGIRKSHKVEHQLSRLIRLLEENPENGRDRENQSGLFEPTNVDILSQNSQLDTSFNIETEDLLIDPCPLQSASDTQPGLITQLSPQPTSEPHDPSPICYDLTMHLVNLYFEKVQPWLPMLHKPRFLKYCATTLEHGCDVLAGLNSQNRLLFLGIFALSARYSESDRFRMLLPRHRGHEFAEKAHSMYSHIRKMQEPSLISVQGAILLAFYVYTSGLSLQGWVLVGDCVRLAYDLGLSELDHPSNAPQPDFDWIHQEELRRTWWLVWELDTFGSIVLLRPFAIDRRHVYVKLPIADQAWFDEERVESEVPIRHRRFEWKALRTSGNKDARGFFLIANMLLAQIYDCLLLREPISVGERTALTNEIQCFRLSMPEMYQFQHGYLLTNNTAATNNWVIGMHLLLSASGSLIDMLPGELEESPNGSSLSEHDLSARHARYLCEISQILRMWPTECLSIAHPFFLCTMTPLFARTMKQVSDHPALPSYIDMVELTQEHFAQYWELGQLIIRLQRVIERAEGSDEERSQLAKQYTMYMRSFMDFQRGISKSARTRERSPSGQRYIGGSCTSSSGRESSADAVQMNDHHNPATIGNSTSACADVLAIPPMILDAAFSHEFTPSDFFNDVPFHLSNH